MNKFTIPCKVALLKSIMEVSQKFLSNIRYKIKDSTNTYLDVMVLSLLEFLVGKGDGGKSY